MRRAQICNFCDITEIRANQRFYHTVLYVRYGNKLICKALRFKFSLYIVATQIFALYFKIHET